MPSKQAIVRYRDKTPVAAWPFGPMQRIVTGGDGGVANVHVAKLDKSLPGFFHTGYDEIYYFLSGTGVVTLDGEVYPVYPGCTVVIPAGTSHALEADTNEGLEFVIFGWPPIPITDARAKPQPA